MAWATEPWQGTNAWAVGNTTAPPPGQTVPPPVPGGTTVYYRWAQQGVYPYAYGGWAGARLAVAYDSGGIVVTPDPDAGVMRLTAWWPNASRVFVMRQNQAGALEPVRGGYGRTVAPTRTNYCPNPSLSTGLNGYVQDVGSPVLTRVDDVDSPDGSTYLRATIATAGSNGVTVPNQLSGIANQAVTVGFALRTLVRPTGVRVTASWIDPLGATLGTYTANLSADDVNRSVAQWARQVVTLWPAVGAATATVKVIADGLPNNGTMDLDAVTIELGRTTGSFFSGSTLGGMWTGVATLSTSVLPELVTLADGECPLDEAVTYIVADLGIAGGQAASPPVVLASGNRSWLTHPGRPGQPFRVSVRAKPKRTYPIPQGRFRPIGRRNAVAVSAARQSAEGNIEINALSRAERTQILTAMADGAPLLLRAPGDYDWDTRWLAIGAVDEDPEGRLGWQDAWLISAEFVEVDPPSVLQ